MTEGPIIPRCDLCGGEPVVTNLDDENLCHPCADAWVRGQQPDQIEDDDIGGGIDG